MLPATALAVGRCEPGCAEAAVMCGFAFTSMLSVVLFLAGLPLMSMAVLAITGVSTIVLESALSARRKRFALGADLEVPEAIVAGDARDTYRAILSAYGEIRCALGDAPLLLSSSSSVVDRCDAAVRQSGRLAVLGNPLQRYLDGHDRTQARVDLDRLLARRDSASDESTATALRRAVTARARQLETYDQILGMRDRIQARLELVRAALESFLATIVKLRVSGEEQLLVTGESVMEDLDSVGDELEVLEAELAIDLAA
ncbi:MAG TPA: hypothetical protein VK601_06070 [Kofleriaceae bacterium]|nr:hypothetical protein [Kofleriaceae bacterium]